MTSLAQQYLDLREKLYSTSRAYQDDILDEMDTIWYRFSKEEITEIEAYIQANPKRPDCGDSSCLYATNRGGMRTNGGCKCDACPSCDAYIRSKKLEHVARHRSWCPKQGWIPLHHR